MADPLPTPPLYRVVQTILDAVVPDGEQRKAVRLLILDAFIRYGMDKDEQQVIPPPPPATQAIGEWVRKGG